jgi:hypothetical protein
MTLADMKRRTQDTCDSDVPVISSIESIEPGQPIRPGPAIIIKGKGLGSGPGGVDVTIQQQMFPAEILEWTNCYVCARLHPDKVVGVRADPAAVLQLTTNTNRMTRQQTSFKPDEGFHTGNDDPVLSAEGKLLPREEAVVVGAILGLGPVTALVGNSDDWTVMDFRLKNDWRIYRLDFETFKSEGDDAHAEITSSPPLNTPNCSARTKVHAGTAGASSISWKLNMIIIGPVGTAYK